ncbi:MAG: hypothetical protein LBT79_02800 [Elusimicrobiota bacterium]|jgi:hypothetical protein|nr:hypothetical protein [Elusimicrobiota bacterium]
MIKNTNKKRIKAYKSISKAAGSIDSVREVHKEYKTNAFGGFTESKSYIIENPYKHYYLLDASAFGRYIDEEYEGVIKHDIIKNKLDDYFYYIPQFCISEVFNMLAKWRYDEEYNKRYKKATITDNRYQELKNYFIKLIHDRLFLYPYDLHRYHNLNAHKIFDIENSVKREQPTDKLSSFDILIIAMGIELQRIHGDKNITILSCDKRLIKVSNLVGVEADYYR